MIGEKAKAFYENLKKKYSKKKNDYKKCNRSGASVKDVEKAERALASYQFMAWLDKFTKLRDCKTNISTPQDEFNLSDDNESVLEDTENSSLDRETEGLEI